MLHSIRVAVVFSGVTLGGSNIDVTESDPGALVIRPNFEGAQGERVAQVMGETRRPTFSLAACPISKMVEPQRASLVISSLSRMAVKMYEFQTTINSH
jgi:hypothetical protein